VALAPPPPTTCTGTRRRAGDARTIGASRLARRSSNGRCGSRARPRLPTDEVAFAHGARLWPPVACCASRCARMASGRPLPTAFRLPRPPGPLRAVWWTSPAGTRSRVLDQAKAQHKTRLSGIDATEWRGGTVSTQRSNRRKTGRTMLPRSATRRQRTANSERTRSSHSRTQATGSVERPRTARQRETTTSVLHIIMEARSPALRQFVDFELQLL